MTEITVLSLGAGVQSTALLMLSAEGVLPKLDAAIFADTGWEPESVYQHLDRLEKEIAIPAGIPIYRVSGGNIREEALDPDHRFASMPLYVMREDGTKGIGRRQCTREYKVTPVQRQIRTLLGAKEQSNGVIGKVPTGSFANQWIGISTDEFQRAKDARVKYIKNVFPLLDLGWDRKTCIEYLKSRGFGDTPKSACIGCPYSPNIQWREMKENYPKEWQDAVDFDEKIRLKNASAGYQMFLHPSCKPLSEAPIHIQSRKEIESKIPTLFDNMMLADNIIGCSPFSCRADEIDFSETEVNLNPDYKEDEDDR